MVINLSAKRLPKALTEWNKYGITEVGSGDPSQAIRELVVKLALDDDSVWKDRINLTGTGREPGKPVTLEGIRRSTENMFRAGSLRYLGLDRQLKMAKSFWQTVTEVFPEAWEDRQKDIQLDDGTWVKTGSTVEVNGRSMKIPALQYRLKDLVGVAAISKLGGEILVEAQGSPDPEDYVRREVEKLEDVNWEKTSENMWTNGQAGFAGQKGLYEALAFLRAHGRAPWEDEN